MKIKVIEKFQINWIQNHTKKKIKKYTDDRLKIEISKNWEGIWKQIYISYS